MKIQKDLISVNFAEGRSWPHGIDQIVVHVMEGTMAGTRSHFRTPGVEASAGYGVPRVGDTVIQYVEDEDTAWHCGRVFAPTAPLVLARPVTNPNSYSIGIEFEGDGTTDLTDSQRKLGAWLLRVLMGRHPLVKLDRTHVVGHHEIFAKKSCPGQIDIDKLLAEAKRESRAGDYPRIVYSDYFHDYLIVTRYVSDAEWYFVPMRNLATGTRAQTRLSAMKLRPEG